MARSENLWATPYRNETMRKSGSVFPKVNADLAGRPLEIGVLGADCGQNGRRRPFFLRDTCRSRNTPAIPLPWSWASLDAEFFGHTLHRYTVVLGGLAGSLSTEVRAGPTNTAPRPLTRPAGRRTRNALRAREGPIPDET